jgi:hypothetical protein
MNEHIVNVRFEHFKRTVNAGGHALTTHEIDERQGHHQGGLEIHARHRLQCEEVPHPANEFKPGNDRRVIVPRSSYSWHVKRAIVAFVLHVCGVARALGGDRRAADELPPPTVPVPESLIDRTHRGVHDMIWRSDVRRAGDRRDLSEPSDRQYHTGASVE